MTQLCVPIFVSSVAQTRASIAAAAEGGADMVELRIDQISDTGMLQDLLTHSILPAIVTCRPEWEGGQSEFTDDQRASLLTFAAENGAALVDLELKTASEYESILRSAPAELPSDLKTKLILSSHDFSGRPTRLYNILEELARLPADVDKIVWMARSIRDNLEVFELLQHRTRPMIALCMGEAGMISRVLAKKFGAFLTFASLSSDSATAPGQVKLADMKRLYRWDAIASTTRVFGVVAQPVMHSMSPAIHNAAFDAIGYDGVYLPMLVEGSYESFKAFMESFIHFQGLDLSGLSITLPHKENALRYLREKGAEIEELASRIGAVNTITIDRNGDEILLRGMNTDYAAILDSITDTLQVSRDGLAGKRIAVIGAGGTGRTAVAALAHHGATVVIYNRTKDRADALAEEFDGRTGKVVSARMEKLCDSCCDIFINTTSLGMHPNVDASPLDGQDVPLNAQTLMFDTIYNPIETKLLKTARAAGAKTISGVEMFVRQAAAQFEAWTGRTAPRDVMRNVVEQRLMRA